MNIFYLHRDVDTCAEMHNDKHVVKMILEYAQLLSTAHRVLDGEEHIYPVLDLVSKKIMEYEKLHYPTGETTPESMMAFLMDQHGHKQKDMKAQRRRTCYHVLG